VPPRVLIACLIAISAHTAEAKRAPPTPVQPVEFRGVRYEAPQACVLIKPQPVTSDGECPNGGIVQAIEMHSGRVLWTLRVYETRYDDSLERDAQDVFVTALRIENGRLVVEDEKKRVFEVDLHTRHVRRRGAGLAPAGGQPRVPSKPSIQSGRASPGATRLAACFTR
jgi:hypothetical protein